MSDIANPLGLNDEQLRALEPQIRLVEAGPGAGKTRTVVARLRRHSSRGRAVAMLSFTNAAVDVARQRCRDVPSLLEPPNFVGTFDSFFRRYVITPASVRSVGRAPTYLASWDDLRDSMSQVRPLSGGAGVPLSKFVFQGGSWGNVDVARLSRSEQAMWDKLSDWSRNDIAQRGAERIAGLHASLVYDTAEARRRALAVLRKRDTSPLPHLARRFEEVIIDEFQDCDEVEHAIVECLMQAGIHVVAVADPDQAIYEFRQANPEIYQQFRDSVPVEQRVSLTTCFRSTPVVCAVVNSLRTVGMDDVVSYADHPGGPDSVFVVEGTGIKAGAAAYKIVKQQGVSIQSTRVLAHRRSDARSLMRAGKEPPRGVSQMESLLVGLIELRSGTDILGRVRAVRRVESFILNQFDWPSTGDVEGRIEQLDRIGRTPASLRAVASSLLQASHDWTDATSCKSFVRRAIENYASEASVGLIANLGRRLVIQPAVWAYWESRTAGALTDMPADELRWGHVHGVKGGEFEAVIVALSKGFAGQSHVLDDWQSGLNSEQRRVLYVGVSRAMRLLVVVVPRAKRAQLEQILSEAGIKHEVVIAR